MKRNRMDNQRDPEKNKVSNFYEDEAWYVLTILARLGSPSSPQEIVSRCRLVSLTEAQVEALCVLPGSPISLSDDGLVFLSKEAVSQCDSVILKSRDKNKASARNGRKRPADLSVLSNRSSKARKVGQSSAPGNAPADRTGCNNGDKKDESSNDHFEGVPEDCLENIVKRAMHGVPIEGCNDHQHLKLGSNIIEVEMLETAEDIKPLNVVDPTLFVPDSVSCDSFPQAMNKLGNKDVIDDRNSLAANKGIETPGLEMIVNIPMDSVHVISVSSDANKENKHEGTCVEDANICNNDSNINESKLGKLCPEGLPKVQESLKKPELNIEEVKAGSVCDPKGHSASRTNVLKKDKCDFQNEMKEYCNDQNTFEKPRILKEKVKKIPKASPSPKDKMDAEGPLSALTDPPSKRLPTFEYFTVEEEEGAGGYGTVYKARRKQDGKVFAIKCPLEKTPSSYVKNEIRTLEKFGRGNNCIIKYEGAVKENGLDCVLLEYVEHEKPEVLRKEIDISDLQWYGYCMFRALKELHKQGIIHRDIKPGNFLFSRKTRSGYLIDFNLALDQFNINSKRTAKPKIPRNQKVTPIPDKPPIFKKKSVPDNHRQKALLAAAEAAENMHISKKASRDNRLFPSTVKNKRLEHSQPRQLSFDNHRHRATRNDEMIRKERMTGDGSLSRLSGAHTLMSPSQDKTKDVTSTRTPSGSRNKEPLPNQGRKELLNFLQEAQQNPNGEVASIPVSQRKRVAAPNEKARVDIGNASHISPMPLAPGFKNPAIRPFPGNTKENKQRKDGPCVGTKGYRAPEVLLRSLYQGSKMDIWSAGISLLYLISGRAPFQASNSEQAIKDIAKVFGKEAIWELAKLHEKEDSLPPDLYTSTSESLAIEEWCRKNTKRPDLLDRIPPSLFDLLSKCLYVNPRLRIGADQALQHEFFSPCHKALKENCDP